MGITRKASKLKVRYRQKTAKLFFRQGGEDKEVERVIIGIEDETGIFYPHPITAALNSYYKKSGSINYEITAADAIIPFLNYVLEQVNEGHPKFTTVEGLKDLTAEHANLFFQEDCVEERGNSLETLSQKEYYISNFYKFLLDENILKKKPRFKKYSVPTGKKGETRTVYKMKFDYKKPDTKGDWKPIKRKDMVPQSDVRKRDRAILRINYVREFLLLASYHGFKDIAFGIALQFYGGLRVAEMVNLTQSAIRTHKGFDYGERGMVLMVRDRQKDLFAGLQNRGKQEVKKPRDQSVLLDPILILLYQEHLDYLGKLKNKQHDNALFYNSHGNPMTTKSFYERFSDLKEFYKGMLLATNGRYDDYRDFADTRWSTHLGRGVFTNMCIDAGFTPEQTAILRGDKSTRSMEAYFDLLSATYNISNALDLLSPENVGLLAGKLYFKEKYDYKKIAKEIKENARAIGIV